ncbi:hypothetical protein Bca52824_033890 [Brassica carinata]|uniref:Uncharacterized protein n=1 Tax=Brassica carinata TaxID=52824 RepID=A0A8X7SDQ3_BRACI|nr:hypothetical protein Bca52824_033890 [Brassica carinata]
MAPPPPDVPAHALNVALGEVREYMHLYASCVDPTESAARKERTRQAEENGELVEIAASMARTTLEAQRIEPPMLRQEITPERLPALQRIGPVSASRSALQRLGPLNDTQEPEGIPQ